METISGYYTNSIWTCRSDAQVTYWQRTWLCATPNSLFFVRSRRMLAPAVTSSNLPLVTDHGRASLSLANLVPACLPTRMKLPVFSTLKCRSPAFQGLEQTSFQDGGTLCRPDPGTSPVASVEETEGKQQGSAAPFLLSIARPSARRARQPLPLFQPAPSGTGPTGPRHAPRPHFPLKRRLRR